MTTPTTTKPNAKSAPTPDAKPVEETPKNRVPAILSENSILGDFCKQYLSAFDEIAAYNKEVLAEKDATWNPAKVLDKAREFASPANAKDVKPEIKKALDKYEDLLTKQSLARKELLNLTADELGITLSATADRNPETEAPLKEKRKVAITIGDQLTTIAGLISDKAASEAVTAFLTAHPMPAIGRDQVRSFGNDGGSTPKYRVNVEVSKDGTQLISESGFTKTALALTKPVFGYERGKAPKSEDLRKAWEAAGNTPEKTVQDKVEFDDNDLHFVISKK